MHQIIGFLFLAMFISCSKNENLNSDKAYFTGITDRDENGVNISKIDTSDWSIHDTWFPIESNLFTSNFNSGCLPAYPYKLIAFPNPCGNKFIVSFDMQPSTRVELRLVNKYYTTLISADSVLGNIEFDVGSLKIKDTVRLYYKFIEGNCEFKGHGDILIE